MTVIFLPIVSYVYFYEIAAVRRLTRFWKVFPVFFAAQLRQCAVLRPFLWYYRPATFTPKIWMIRRNGPFLYIQAVKLIRKILKITFRI